MKQVLKMTDIRKDYIMGEEEVFHVLKGLDFEVNEGDYIAILGPSGSGKSTFMNIIGCLDEATSGEYILAGKDIKGRSDKELSIIRNKEIGFIFQNFQLLQRMSILDNVMLPMIYQGLSLRERKKRAEKILRDVGLETKFRSLPSQLSGGQQQRVAIARALVTNPSILLADEPTGALDQKTGIEVMELFDKLNAEGRTIIMITHSAEIASRARRVYKIVDGLEEK
ncbi:MAG: ABC transporter ATP-binding protein [Bacillota bacterium]